MIAKTPSVRQQNCSAKLRSGCARDGLAGRRAASYKKDVVAHAISTSSFRSDHMSPSALALAVLLHALVALALWSIALNPRQPPAEEPIDVTFEQPKPEPPPPPPPQPKVQPPLPASPLELGHRPPAPITFGKPPQVPPAGERPKEPPAPPPPPLRDVLPQPEPQAAPPTPAELAKPTPPLPVPQEHAPGPQQALVAPPQHPPLPTQPAHPQPQARPQLERPELRPSPLTTAPPHRPPGGKPAEDASPSPFVNPADTYNRARVADNYLWQVVSKLIGYRYEAHVSARQGLTVVRVVIARDGRLLDVQVARSSGYPEFDRGVVAGVRAGSPYTPLPPEIHGDSATFDLPLVSVNRQ